MERAETKFPISVYSAKGEGIIVNSHISENAMEIVEVVSGTLKVQVGTDFAEATVGDFVCVPPRLMFRAECEGTGAVRGIIFDMSIIEANTDNFEGEILYMFDVRSRSNITLFDESAPAHSALKKCMNECFDEYSAKDVCYKLPIRANIYIMMTALLRTFCGSKDERDRMIYHNVLRLRPAVDYIKKNYFEKTYIEKLSDMINVSPDYFTKMFKDSIGKTPIDYINAMRINHAMYSLACTDKSVAEISEETGFCNPNYFHKIFKQYTDKSPLAYRKSVKQ